MAYNNYFPAGYQPMYQQPYQYQAITQSNQQAVNNGLIWIQGEAGAKSYLVAPNTTVALWDSEAQVVYLKSADASGMPSMKVLDYTIRGDSAPVAAVSQNMDTPYATKEDLTAIQSEIDGLRTEMERISVTRRRRKEESDNE